MRIFTSLFIAIFFLFLNICSDLSFGSTDLSAEQLNAKRQMLQQLDAIDHYTEPFQDLSEGNLVKQLIEEQFSSLPSESKRLLTKEAEVRQGFIHKDLKCFRIIRQYINGLTGDTTSWHNLVNAILRKTSIMFEDKWVFEETKTLPRDDERNNMRWFIHDLFYELSKNQVEAQSRMKSNAVIEREDNRGT